MVILLQMFRKTELGVEQEMVPKYLYKIISSEDWRKSQGMESVKLSDADHDFIHLAKEDQLDKIIEKYWANIPEFVVLKIYTDQLPRTIDVRSKSRRI